MKILIGKHQKIHIASYQRKRDTPNNKFRNKNGTYTGRKVLKKEHLNIR